MRITYKTSVADYRAAYRMYQRKNLFLRYDQIIWPAVTVLCLVAIVASDSHSALNRVGRELIIYPLLLSVGLPLLRALNAYRIYRDVHKETPSRPEVTTEITPEQIVDVTPGESNLAYTWPSVVGFGQNAKITVICMKSLQLIFFPTSVLSSNQRAELDELVSRHGIKRWS